MQFDIEKLKFKEMCRLRLLSCVAGLAGDLGENNGRWSSIDPVDIHTWLAAIIEVDGHDGLIVNEIHRIRIYVTGECRLDDELVCWDVEVQVPQDIRDRVIECTKTVEIAANREYQALGGSKAEGSLMPEKPNSVIVG